MKKLYCLLLLTASLIGCAVGPNYQPPATVAELPMDWHWQKAQPQDATPKGNWWKLLNDPQLDALEEQALAQNSDLRAAVARVDQGRAQARLQGAAFFPSLTLDPSYKREQLPKDNPSFSKVPIPGILQRFEADNRFSVPLDLSYEIDVWGRVRRLFESAQAQAQASVADYENIRLTLASDVAINYLTLEEYDREIQILEETAKNRSESLRINRVRVQAGRATNEDVFQAETEFTNAQADLASVQRNRAETQNALAVLTGNYASNFILPTHPLTTTPPEIPVGLPASLLERRPDIAEAERNMAAANAQIGVAYAAFFPRITLTGQGGYLSARATDLFTWPNTVWSIGPAISLPIFNGGENLANVKIARAKYNESVANYRQSVLNAVRDVEDALADLHFLRDQKEALVKSTQSARDAEDLANRRFRVGQTNYTDVIVAQQAELTAQRSQAQISGQEFYATVRLIKALGGGWSEGAALPEDSVMGSNTTSTPAQVGGQ